MSKRMPHKKLVTVFGATGAAGGSVAKYLLEDGTFAVRAVTRNADSPSAQALKAQGAEVVVADLDKPETIPAALKGTYGVSAVTDFWALFAKSGSAETALQGEVTQGKALVDAAKAEGVQHFLLFTLWHAECPHLASKSQINEYLKASGLPRTSFYNAFYFENLVGFGGLVKKADGGKVMLEIPIPERFYVPSYSVEQTGAWVLAAFKRPDKWIGKDMIAVAEHLTPRQYADVLSKVFGKEVVIPPLSLEEFEQRALSSDPFIVEMFLGMKFFIESCQPHSTVYDEAASKEAHSGSHAFQHFIQNNVGFRQKFMKLIS